MRDIKMTILGCAFTFGLMVTGCSLDHAFDSRENTLAWLAVLAFTVIAATLMGRGE